MQNFMTVAKINKKKINILLALGLLSLFIPWQSVLASYEISDGSVKALYHLEDNVDSSGNGYTLTNHNSIVFSAGLLNDASDLGAGNSTKYFDVASDLGITYNSNFSMFAFIKIDSEVSAGNQYYGILNKITTGNPGSQYNIFYYYNGGTPQIVFRRVGSASVDATYNVTLGTTNWHMVGLTYDGSNLRGYFDGVNVATQSASGGGNITDASRVVLGQYNTSGLFYNRYIDESAFLDKKLTDSDFTSIYNSGLGDEVCVSAGCGGGTSTPPIETFETCATTSDIGKIAFSYISFSSSSGTTTTQGQLDIPFFLFAYIAIILLTLLAIAKFYIKK